MLIKLWDWDKGWQCTQVFEGHSHYVMQVAFNPKDTNTFASASLDRTIKVWSLGQAVSNFTLEGHEKGVNCVDYFSGGDRPYLISGADDKLVKARAPFRFFFALYLKFPLTSAFEPSVAPQPHTCLCCLQWGDVPDGRGARTCGCVQIWDYQTKSCVQTLEGHSHNVSAVCFHPELPIIITGSEDGTLRLWHSTTYRLENTLNYGLERVWTLSVLKGSNNVAVGYDEGTVMFKIGREEPVASMDTSGKIVWARHNEIQTVNVRSVGADDLVDGERLPLPVKDLGSCDLYPQALVHNPNGRFVVVCGDGEYIIYTALAWRNKSFGTALDFAWSADSSEFATRESTSRIKTFKNFQEKKSIRPNFAAEGIHGGPLLSARSADFICFYDWAECRVIRRIDVAVKDIWWAESGELVCISSDTSFYILKYNREMVDTYLASGEPVDENEGIEDAFELLYEIGERVRTAVWMGDCFIYNNSEWRLNYCVGGEVTTIFHLDRPMYILGYMASQNRLYLIDRDFAIVSYTLLMSAIEFKTLVLREEVEAAFELLSDVPVEMHSGLARFLESRGLIKEALKVATEPDYKFELAIQLGDLSTAVQIAGEAATEAKWKQLGELALSSGELPLAESCLTKAADLSGLLLMYSSTGNASGMKELAETARAAGKHNVAFLCLFLLSDLDGCITLLCETGRVPEAAFMARTYLPSKASEVVALWRDDLAAVNKKAAEALADPAEYSNLFPNFELALQAEKLAAARYAAVKPAASFPAHEANPPTDPLEAVSGGGDAADEAEVDEVEVEAEAPAPSPKKEATPPSSPKPAPPSPKKEATPPPSPKPTPPAPKKEATPPPSPKPTPVAEEAKKQEEEEEEDLDFGDAVDDDEDVELDDDDWGEAEDDK
jgi:coatomer subunit beta'